MARITFKNPNDHLSGTLCGLVYKNRNGKNFVYSQPEPVLPKRPTKEQRLKYRKDCVVQNCVSLIQSDMLDRRKLSIPEMQRVADMHNAIRTTVCRWYDYYRPYFKTDFALEKAIVYYYHTKNLPPELNFLMGTPTDANDSASGGESGGIGRLNERETLSPCDPIAERVWNLVEPLSSHPRTIVEPFA